MSFRPEGAPGISRFSTYGRFYLEQTLRGRTVPATRTVSTKSQEQLRHVG